jgi:hypothetical protein
VCYKAPVVFPDADDRHLRLASEGAAGGGWLPRSGLAEPAQRPDRPTIPGPVSVRLLSPPQVGASCGVEAPAGSIPIGSCFAVRFFSGAARRVVLGCASLAPGPGGIEVLACDLVAEAPAPERQHARHAVDRRVAAIVEKAEAIPVGTQLDVQLVNASASGAMIATAAVFAHGDVIALDLPDGPAAIEIFRRDARAGRWGARFVDAERGRTALATLLEHERG